MTRQEVIEHLTNIGGFDTSYSYGNMKACIEQVFDELENKDKTTKNDFVFTNCNDCKHKINGVFQEECISCKRYYACHFEKK